MFAILSLRALYAVVNHAVASARFLSQPSVAIVLLFIGVKMLLALAGVVEVPVGASLAVVAGVLSAGVAMSVLYPKKPQGDGDGETQAAKAAIAGAV